jgi:hypothetical protein
MVLPDYTSYYVFLGPNRTPGPSKKGESDLVNVPHFRNFIQAVRSRNPGDLTAKVRDLHYSSAMAHLANISYRTQRMLDFDPEGARFKADDEANRRLTREYTGGYVVPWQV